MSEYYYNILMRLARKAASKDEVPVSALLVKNGKIIAKKYNKREKTNNILNHAEILVIRKAAKRLKTWHLDDCDLYVTLKPCNMCNEVIKQSHIKNVYYLLNKSEKKKEYNKVNVKRTNVRYQTLEYSYILSDFFKKKRDKKKHI